MSEEAVTKSLRMLIDARQLAADVNFSATDLDGAMVGQAALFLNYGMIAARAEKQMDDIKIRLDLREAEIDKEIRDRAANDGGKVTESGIMKEIDRHPSIVTLKKIYNEAKMMVKISGVAMESFRHRKDMIVQLGATSREELKGELRMNAAKNMEDDRQARMKRVMENMSAATRAV